MISVLKNPGDGYGKLIKKEWSRAKIKRQASVSLEYYFSNMNMYM